MIYVEFILIAISLSIDAFSLALSIGINKNINRKYIVYSIIVGIYHFFMPIIGFILRNIIRNIIYIPNREIFIIVLVFLIIGIIIDKNDHKNIINPYLFGLSVSIDSFIIGFTVRKKYIVISSLIFSIVSFMFTIVGFKLGKEITKKLNNKSKIISVFILIFLLIYNLLNYVKA